MTTPNRIRARTDRIIEAELAPQSGSSPSYYTNIQATLSEPEAVTQRILDPNRWESGTAVISLAARKLNHGQESQDPRTCLNTGISDHPQITDTSSSYKATMQDGRPIPPECLTCVISALLQMSAGIQEVPVHANFL